MSGRAPERKPSIRAALEEAERMLEIGQGKFGFKPYSKLQHGAVHEARQKRIVELLRWLDRDQRLIKQRLEQ